MTTKETKHTPGPWKVTNSLMVMSKTNRSIADCCIDYSGDSPLKTGLTNACNARLIAAAPDMFAALKTLFKHCAMVHKCWGDGDNTKEADAAIKAGEAAIASATKE